MAALIKEGTAVSAVELISGDRGEFSIWVGNDCVARKDSSGYPPESAIVSAVAAALS